MIYKRAKTLLSSLSPFCKVIFAFSVQKGCPKRYSLTESEQSAALSYYTLKFINDEQNIDYKKDFRSLREKLFDRVLFTDQIIKYINEHSRFPIKEFGEIGVSDATFDKVLEGFQLGKGCEITDSLLRKGHFKNFANCSPRKAVLNPLAHSARIIGALISGKGALITGEKNTGKSFAILTYAYLSNFILKCKDQNSEFSPDFFEIVPKLSFFSLPKLIYLSLLDDKDLRESDLREQMEIPHTEAQIDLKSIIEDQKKKGNRFICVVDKGQEYEKAFKKRQQQLAQSYSKQLQQLCEIFDQGLFLKSECDIDKDAMRRYNERGQIELFQYMRSSKKSKQRQKIDINYPQIFHSQLGQSQLYSIFLLEIIQHLLSLGINPQKIQAIRQSFKLFVNQQKYDEWNTDIRPHTFRLFFSKFDFSNIVNEFNKNQINQQIINKEFQKFIKLMTDEIYQSLYKLFQNFYKLPGTKQQIVTRAFKISLQLSSSVRGIHKREQQQKYVWGSCNPKDSDETQKKYSIQLLKQFQPIVYHQIENKRVRVCVSANVIGQLTWYPFQKFFIWFSTPMHMIPMPFDWPRRPDLENNI